MSRTRKSARFVMVAGLLAALTAPALAQQPYPGQPYPGQPYPGQPGQPGPQRGRFAHACFPADQGGYLRVEWPQSGRWAIYRWPPGSNIRVFIGDEQAQWCWSPRFAEMARPCRPNYEVTKPVTPGC